MFGHLLGGKTLMACTSKAGPNRMPVSFTQGWEFVDEGKPGGKPKLGFRTLLPGAELVLQASPSSLAYVYTCSDAGLLLNCIGMARVRKPTQRRQ